MNPRDIIAGSSLFDAAWYLVQNPDVAAAGMDPALHYVLHGAGEGRDPGPQFSTAGYLAAHPDVERASMNPLLHFVLHGKSEGRTAPPSTSMVRILPAAAKREYENRLIEEFEKFLASGERIAIPAAQNPTISLIIVLYNKAHFTYACLRSIHCSNFELQLVDSGSTDKTGDLLNRSDGARITRLKGNLHFVRSVNLAAEQSRGDYIVLLNNDAILRPNALQYAAETLKEDSRIAAVGGKILLPGGVLQEAGCVIHPDGSTAGYGRGHSPLAGEYNFRRDVAFCSGAFLMIRRDVWKELGGFDERFAPAYYEETDLCVRMHQAGYRVVYDPRVELLHYEFGSSESSDTALELQARNRSVFLEKHRSFLSGGVDAIGKGHKRILFIDDHVPYPELGVGYPRARDILHTLHRDGYFVTFIPLEYPNESWESLRRVVPLDVEVMLGVTALTLGSFLSSRRGRYDLIFVSRPNNMAALVAASTEDVPILYDAEAIWAKRVLLQSAIEGKPAPDEEAKRLLEEEMSLARAASHVISVNEIEAAEFRAHGCPHVSIVAHGFRLSQPVKDFSERKDLLFIGSLDDDASPNTDALVWFVREVMPHIRPLKLVVAGRSAAPRVRALASEDVLLLGKVDDLSNVYEAARVFVAPHRFAGGIPTKVLETAAHGVPCIVSELLANQLGWQGGAEILVAKTAGEFVQSIRRLYGDEQLWRSMRDRAWRAMERGYSKQAFYDSLAGCIRETIR